MKICFTTIALVAICITQCELNAAVVYCDIPDSTTGLASDPGDTYTDLGVGNGGLYIDLDGSSGSQAISHSGFEGADFKIVFMDGFPEMPFLIGSQVITPIDSLEAALFNYGDEISLSGHSWAGGQIVFDRPDAPYTEWHGGANGYFGVMINDCMGYIHGFYNSNNNEVTVFSFAYETTPNTPILAGTIPEPNACVLALCGVVTFWAIRSTKRRMKST